VNFMPIYCHGKQNILDQSWKNSARLGALGWKNWTERGEKREKVHKMQHALTIHRSSDSLLVRFAVLQNNTVVAILQLTVICKNCIVMDFTNVITLLQFMQKSQYFVALLVVQ